MGARAARRRRGLVGANEREAALFQPVALVDDDLHTIFLANAGALQAAGIQAVLFGAGNAGQTTYTDAKGDGITNESGVPTKDAAGAAQTAIPTSGRTPMMTAYSCGSSSAASTPIVRGSSTGWLPQWPRCHLRTESFIEGSSVSGKPTGDLMILESR